MSNVILWFIIFLGALSFVYALKTDDVNSYLFYTISFAVCAATVGIWVS